ncbi:uncharacterized protein PHACADRAFT_249698 [Phanerochaete carnosa HHB-10118-sp]|uniref:HMG box domain-containing protein n=1 Tax=Phanerochaete carnosa (strain HHB-10118-sp) TaxID=650164 RepID=K5WJM0_PHACS|nr:uncharacterized protein PHACADRAFT_249698 [Phanerochaete carnosa HHB-10118-sp]EKM59299.1 hypothetical protein PHACADRAFT_249698 [Phanerochaete carnosa HHB-10118-sp]
MPVSPIFRHSNDDGLAIAIAASDMSLNDHSPFLSGFDAFDSADANMIFQFDDAVAYESKQHMSWEPTHDYSLSSPSFLPGSPESTSSQLDLGAPLPHLPPGAQTFSSFADVSQHAQQDFSYSQWLQDDATCQPSSSSPINIPISHSHSSTSSLAGFSDSSSIFPDVGPFSPTTAYAALQPLPRSFSPGEDDYANQAFQAQPALSTSPSEPPLTPPTWATQLWTPPSTTQPLPATPSLAVPQTPDEEDAFATQRPRMAMRRSFAPVSELFPSSSAPSMSHMRPSMSRSYSRRAESTSEHDDATVRRKKRSLVSGDEEHRPTERTGEGKAGDAPQKSLFRPPKLAPSAWQLYFTDWIQRHQATSPKKLNVAQAAKEAGQEYARLSSEEKEPYRRRSQAAKEAREREHSAYMRTLTPEDIKRENAFRTAQRKAGKSRKGNIKDPNAPKKPLSAYFMFLQRIRSDAALVLEVFGDETETTKQSVLAAAKWRSMTDEERKPFLAQAEQEKLEYEAARKMYEDGTVGSSSSINFSILPNNPINSIVFPSSSFLRPVKQEAASSESEGEDVTAESGELARRRAHSHA